jgi:hypothetical protein
MLLTGLKAGAENGCQQHIDCQAKGSACHSRTVLLSSPGVTFLPGPSGRRTVKVDGTTNVIEINDSYFLTEPVDARSKPVRP